MIIKARHKNFDFTEEKWQQWHRFMDAIEEFVTKVGPDCIIGITQPNESEVNVWYWDGQRLP